MTDLGVGIIGVRADRGWAREAHVPAVRHVEGLELVAVANRSADSARAAAEAFDVPAGYGDPAELIADPRVDVVTVAASVPAHFDLIGAAIRAGKHVMTEWPVTTHLEQTARLTEQATTAGVATAVGLQAAVNPAVIRAAQLIDTGAIGRPLYATVLSTTAGFGPRVGAADLYLEDPATGMNLPTIQTAHTLDVVGRLLGAPTSAAAQLTVQYPDLQVEGRAEPFRRTIADHVLIGARYASGTAASVQVVGGRPADDTPFRLDVVGERATLALAGGAPRGFQAGVLDLRLDGVDVGVDGEPGMPDSVVNVARNYAALRDTIAGSAPSGAPTFAHALGLAHLLDDVLGAAADGGRAERHDAWPT